MTLPKSTRTGSFMKKLCASTAQVTKTLTTDGIDGKLVATWKTDIPVSGKW